MSMHPHSNKCPYTNKRPYSNKRPFFVSEIGLKKVHEHEDQPWSILL